MRIVLKQGLIAIAAGDDGDAALLDEFADVADDHVFHLQRRGRGLVLQSLGRRADACNEPINVHSGNSDPAIRLIGNLAHTPFNLGGDRFASVEGFWQGLKFEDEAERRRVGQLHGLEAKRAGRAASYAERTVYRGQSVRVGRGDHWALMKLACAAKFRQHEEARAALLGTGSRPLVHKVRGDSDTIPAVVMADIWMRIRATLRKD
jgi:predicted NAD-dependent protein-ADP-ribosyltransferase YbiA (DUF1768 family)